MANVHAAHRGTPLPPPTKHQLALMIWAAVVPTLTVLNRSVQVVESARPGVHGPRSRDGHGRSAEPPS
jgi:hypothetical protein